MSPKIKQILKKKHDVSCNKKEAGDVLMLPCI